MRLVFVHGWSVTHTNTYGDLPQGLADRAGDFGLDIDIAHIQLGKYISFDDEVTLDDIARAFDAALRDLPDNTAAIQPFSVVTHSTGGPVVRHWIERFYGARRLAELPLSHLVMLAPASHGSALAVIGKKRLGRIKAWFNGVEPGQQVLDWLSLGSEGQWALNSRFLSYSPAGRGFFPFVLTGQGIDTKAYDFLNTYLVENGSDGVVRVAGANLNQRHITLEQTDERYRPTGGGPRHVFRLQASSRTPVRKSPGVPLGVFANLSHSGRKMGIMRLRSTSSEFTRVVDEILRCLRVSDRAGYAQRGKELEQLTAEEQSKVPEGKKELIGRYSMMAFRVSDQNGRVIEHSNYDILLLAGRSYSKDELPQGFFIDRQMNRTSNCLVYYVDADKMSAIKDNLWGIQVIVRPQSGFSHYSPVEFRSEGLNIANVIAPNETTYVDIRIRRQVDTNVFQLEPAGNRPSSFKKTRPSGTDIDG